MAENTVVRSQQNGVRPEATRNAQFVAPRVDIFETDHELLLLADLPGVDPKEVDLRYERGELILRARPAEATHHGQPVLQEYEAGEFYRVFQIHETIDAGKIEADYKNGVLTVHLPKQEAVKPKQVKVRAG